MILPTVHVRGQLGTDPVDETYSPAFTMKRNATQLVPDSSLNRTQPKSISETVTDAQHSKLFGLALTVPTARWLSAGVGGGALALAALFAAIVFLGLGQDEAMKARARFGVRLVAVKDADRGESQVVRVAAMRDLARLAQRDGRIIFHQTLPESDVYFVPDGTVTYEYESARRAEA